MSLNASPGFAWSFKSLSFCLISFHLLGESSISPKRGGICQKTEKTWVGSLPVYSSGSYRLVLGQGFLNKKTRNCLPRHQQFSCTHTSKVDLLRISAGGRTRLQRVQSLLDPRTGRNSIRYTRGSLHQIHQILMMSCLLYHMVCISRSKHGFANGGERPTPPLAP